MMKTFLSVLFLSSLAFAEVQKNVSSKLEAKVLGSLDRLHLLVNPQESLLEIQKESIRCSAAEAFEDGTPTGACIFEATGKSDAIDLLFVLTVKNPGILKTGTDNWSLTEVSRHED